jgi:heme-degrading monooxygenase HmoA
MYLRFVQVKIKEETLPELRRIYEETIIPALQSTDGCLFVSLIHNIQHPEECISMTMWSAKQKSEAYEQSGAFDTLLGTSKPLFDDSSEWQIHLSDDLTLTYDPIPQEPVVKAYTVSSSTDPAKIPQGTSLYIRIVSHRVQTGMKDAFTRIYNTEILPFLRNVSGCRYATLCAEMVQDESNLISISIWDARSDADNYERSGLFDTFVQKLSPTLSGMYQWKMQLQRETHAQVMTTNDVTVEGYSIITGKSFTR